MFGGQFNFKSLKEMNSSQSRSIETGLKQHFFYGFSNDCHSPATLYDNSHFYLS